MPPKSVQRPTQNAKPSTSKGRPTDEGTAEKLTIKQIRINQTLNEDHFHLLGVIKTQFGLQYEQDVVRLAVSQFLQRKGLIDF